MYGEGSEPAAGAAGARCRQAPKEGGEWLLSDGRAIFQQLHPDVVQKFQEKSACYQARAARARTATSAAPAHGCVNFKGFRRAM